MDEIDWTEWREWKVIKGATKEEIEEQTKWDCLFPQQDIDDWLEEMEQLEAQIWAEYWNSEWEDDAMHWGGSE